MVSASARREPAWFRIPYRLARGGERVRRAGNVLYCKRRVRSLSGCTRLRNSFFFSEPSTPRPSLETVDIACKLGESGKPAKEVLDYSLSFRLRWRQRLRIYAALQSEVSPMALTKRQKEVLDYLVAFETKHGYAPSFEEIGKGMKLTSLATVHKHITTLEKKGFIRRGYNQSRSIEILQLPKSVKDQVIERRVQELPLVGRIAAGRPLEAVEERETLSLGDFARGGNSFVLQVKGTSMIEDHIMDGDYVVCEQTQVANAGEIVVAL